MEKKKKGEYMGACYLLPYGDRRVTKDTVVMASVAKP